MSERISRLMDGDVDDSELDGCCSELKSDDAVSTWICYHVIGDHLRGTGAHSRRIAARVAVALSAEPTVLAPRTRTPVSQPATFAWAIAATLAAVTVVGWTAFSMVDEPPTAVAKAREAASVRAAQVKPPADVPADYLVAHQEYSPGAVIQGGGAMMRAVSTTPAELRP